MGAAGVILVGGIFVLFTGIDIFPSGEEGKEAGSTALRQRTMEGTLIVWGLFDAQTNYTDAIEAFTARYPTMTVEYKRFTSETSYKQELIDALAAGKGPDIFMIRNTDLGQYVDKTVPLSLEALPRSTLDSIFPEVVGEDFVREEGIYALPLTIDTLALIYNKDHFNQAAIIFPPETWSELQAIIPDLVQYNEDGSVRRRGIAIGGSNENVDNGSHLLELLVLQERAIQGQGFAITSPESERAMSFYTQFAAPGENRTWEISRKNSVETFAAGDTAIIFNYHRTLKDIKRKNGILKIGIAPMLQIENTNIPVAYPRYWGYVVAAQSTVQTPAWDFITRMTTDPDRADAYAIKANAPPALRVLIDKYKDDPERGVFARQALIARSWGKIDGEMIDDAFSRAIETVILNGTSIRDALGGVQNAHAQAANRWTQ